MKLSIVFLILFVSDISYAHRSGCHRWHSCPSDTGSYVCGDTGHSNFCPSTTPKIEIETEIDSSKTLVQQPGLERRARDLIEPSEAEVKPSIQNITQQQAVFPKSARARGVAGVVSVDYIFSKDGRVKKAFFKNAADASLTRAVIHALKGYRNSNADDEKIYSQDFVFKQQR